MNTYNTYPYILSDAGVSIIREVQTALDEYVARMKMNASSVTWYDIACLSDQLKVVNEEIARLGSEPEGVCNA